MSVIERNFSVNASRYDQYSAIQYYCGEQLLEYLSLAPSCRILDLGCATGKTTYQLSKRCPEARITAIDFAPGMIAWAKNHHAHPSIHYHCEDIFTFNPEFQFDSLFSNVTFQWLNRSEVRGPRSEDQENVHMFLPSMGEGDNRPDVRGRNVGEGPYACPSSHIRGGNIIRAEDTDTARRVCTRADNPFLFRRLSSWLKPFGIAGLSIFGPQTFCELAFVLKKHLRISSFLSSETFLPLPSWTKVTETYFKEDLVKEERITVLYPTLLDFLKTIHATGAQGNGVSPKRLWTHRLIAHLDKEYRQIYGGISVTYQIFYIILRKRQIPVPK